MSHPNPLCPAHNTDDILIGCRCNDPFVAQPVEFHEAWHPHRYTSRVYRCATPGCPWRGRIETVRPQPLSPSLVETPRPECGACGQQPKLLRIDRDHAPAGWDQPLT